MASRLQGRSRLTNTRIDTLCKNWALCIFHYDFYVQYLYVIKKLVCVQYLHCVHSQKWLERLSSAFRYFKSTFRNIQVLIEYLLLPNNNGSMKDALKYR